MSITLLNGGTTTTSGGTAQVFEVSGETITDGRVLVDVGEADFFARNKLNITSRSPSQQSDGTWSKSKRTVVLVIPFTRADGSTVYNTTRVEVSFDPETTSAELADLRERGAQLLKDSEFDTFYSVGQLP